MLNGYADGTFRPYTPITRAQLSKMIVTARSWARANPASPTNWPRAPS
ncbi:MAG TPA: S-layer homology domain-containing protein [Chloroflexia bacterium]|nr:S-layer homology domain-containing protein [Chloroflexia bacterium]